MMSASPTPRFTARSRHHPRGRQCPSVRTDRRTPLQIRQRRLRHHHPNLRHSAIRNSPSSQAPMVTASAIAFAVNRLSDSTGVTAALASATNLLLRHHLQQQRIRFPAIRLRPSSSAAGGSILLRHLMHATTPAPSSNAPSDATPSPASTAPRPSPTDRASPSTHPPSTSLSTSIKTSGLGTESLHPHRRRRGIFQLGSSVQSNQQVSPRHRIRQRRPTRKRQ